MGAGIAYVAASAGLDVVLIDRDQEAADKGKAHSEKLISSQIAKGRAKSADRDALLARIHAERRLCRAEGLRPRGRGGVRGPRGQGGGDQARRRPWSAATRSSPPTPRLCRSARSPRRRAEAGEFHRHPFLLAGRQDDAGRRSSWARRPGPRALATALDFVRAIKKTPIVVNDCRGFFANRCVGAYIREGHLMLMEGVPPAMIENAAQHGRHAGRAAQPQRRGGDRPRLARSSRRPRRISAPTAVDPAQETLLEAMVVKEQRFGRKNGKGFYDYPGDAGQDAVAGPGRRSPARRSIPTRSTCRTLKDRFLYAQALEAARCMEEDVVTDPREADVGSILGFGFAPFTGGVLSLIDGMGAKAFVARAEELAAKYGSRFAPGAELKAMAAKGETFYGQAAKKVGGVTAIPSPRKRGEG